MLDNTELSKQLLSEVLQVQVIDIYCFLNEYETAEGKYNVFPNTYELQYLFKEWLKDNNYTVLSGYSFNFILRKYDTDGVLGYCCQIQNSNFKINDFYENSEFEAILKACKFVLKEKQLAK